MLLHCHSRKCNTTRDHKLKMDTNDVLCMDCGEANTMVSDFMKNAMKSSGDLYRSVQKRAFMYKCPKCTVDRGVKIVDEQALCDSCSHPLSLSAPMIEAIKVGHVVVPKTDNSDEQKEELQKGVIKRKKTG